MPGEITLKLYKPLGLRVALWVCASVGFLWGLGECMVAFIFGCINPHTIF
jgi:hypothetical protein